MAKKESPDDHPVCKRCPSHVPMHYDPTPDDPNTTPLPTDDEVMAASKRAKK